MRHALAVFCVLTIVASAAGVALADPNEMVFLNNTDNGGGGWYSGSPSGEFLNPTATTDGAFWIKVGNNAPVLGEQDFYLAAYVEASNGIWLPFAANPIFEPASAPIWGSIYAGYFERNTSNWLPTGDLAGSVGNRHFMLNAWTGSYSTFEAAVAGGAYCGINRFWNGTTVMPDIPPSLTNMSALVLRKTLPGDANLDGTVDITDLSKVLANYDKTDRQWIDGDFDGSGTVDIQDLSKVLTNYDKTASASAAGIKAVPEPAGLVLLAVAFVGLLAGRRMRSR